MAGDVLNQRSSHSALWEGKGQRSLFQESPRVLLKSDSVVGMVPSPRCVGSRCLKRRRRDAVLGSSGWHARLQPQHLGGEEYSHPWLHSKAEATWVTRDLSLKQRRKQRVELKSQWLYGDLVTCIWQLEPVDLGMFGAFWVWIHSCCMCAGVHMPYRGCGSQGTT